MCTRRVWQGLASSRASNVEFLCCVEFSPSSVTSEYNVNKLRQRILSKCVSLPGTPAAPGGPVRHGQAELRTVPAEQQQRCHLLPVCLRGIADMPGVCVCVLSIGRA